MLIYIAIEFLRAGHESGDWLVLPGWRCWRQLLQWQRNWSCCTSRVAPGAFVSRRRSATAYPRTSQAAVAPLRRVDITKDWPDGSRFRGTERFTPSFVLVHEGHEVSRMRGYAGDQFFWFLLDEMIAKLPVDAATAPSPEG